MSGIWPNNKAKKTRDTKTGLTYRSRNQAGKAVAREAGVDPNHRPSPWVLVVKEFPGRFQDVETGKLIGKDGNVIE